MLVTRGAGYFLSSDLVLFLEMGLVHEDHLFGELDLFSPELVVRFPMAVGSDAVGNRNRRLCPNRFTPEGEV